MAAMLVQVQFVMIMRMMKSEAASAGVTTVSAQSGARVMLTSERLGGNESLNWDIRWTHTRMVLSLKNNMTSPLHGGPKVERNGSLMFSQVSAKDAGNYSLQVFDQSGQRIFQVDFLLKVEEKTLKHMTWLLLLCLLPLFIIVFVLKKRRIQSLRTLGSVEENVYVSMRSHHDNKRKEKKEEGGEELVYAAHHPTISMGTPINEEMSEEAEDVYM